MLRLPVVVRMAALSMVSVMGSGCVAYAPISNNDPLPTGTEVRVFLSEPASVDLIDETVNNVVRVDGEAVTWDGDELWLSAWWLRRGTGSEHKAIGETVFIPRDNVSLLERKRVSVTRSIALVGFAALVGILGNAALGPGSGPGSGNGTVGPEK